MRNISDNSFCACVAQNVYRTEIQRLTLTKSSTQQSVTAHNWHWQRPAHSNQRAWQRPVWDPDRDQSETLTETSTQQSETLTETSTQQSVTAHNASAHDYTGQDTHQNTLSKPTKVLLDANDNFYLQKWGTRVNTHTHTHARARTHTTCSPPLCVCVCVCARACACVCVVVLVRFLFWFVRFLFCGKLRRKEPRFLSIWMQRFDWGSTRALVTPLLYWLNLCCCRWLGARRGDVWNPQRRCAHLCLYLCCTLQLFHRLPESSYPYLGDHFWCGRYV